ncbi:MAG: hypothetical protein WC223_11540 [Bacteroidales bacterium]|jgi:hypothetical protein
MKNNKMHQQVKNIRRTNNISGNHDRKRHFEENIKRKNKFPEYPLYPSDEDIYYKEKEVDINPDDFSIATEPNKKKGKPNEKDFNNLLTGDDLDVPGSELDDEDENIGEEDEENNYYSLGGENHDD